MIKINAVCDSSIDAWSNIHLRTLIILTLSDNPYSHLGYSLRTRLILLYKEETNLYLVFTM